MKNKAFSIGTSIIQPGERKMIELSAASLYTQTPINIPIHIINGKVKGPRIFIVAAVHGDEINGVEIIRRLLRHPYLNQLKGTLIAIPVANVHGFITLSRYLPDRRDLNRSFPGSEKGSLAAKLAYVYETEIIKHCTHGIDLHTGNIHSENLPHIRTNLKVKGALKMARAFNVPVILDAKIRDGSIRQAASELGIPLLVYEGGEALRFNEIAIRIGVKGILQVLKSLNMLEALSTNFKKVKSCIAYTSTWARSVKSGIFHQSRWLGTDVEQGEKLGFIADPFSKKETEVFSPAQGVIIGRNTLPLVNEGDALFHIAKIKSGEDITCEINELQNYYLNDPFD